MDLKKKQIIPSITGLATITALTVFENKIPNVSNLAKKRDSDAKISDIESKYFTTSDYNKFTRDILDAKIKEKRLVDKSDIAGFINNADLNNKAVTLATKAELKAEQAKITKLQVFDSSYFCGKSHFEDDSTQNYVVFQPIYIYFKKLAILSIFQRGNLKDCMMKVLSLLLHLEIILFDP